MSAVPQTRDLLGAATNPGAVRRVSAAFAAIPNNESVLFELWITARDTSQPFAREGWGSWWILLTDGVSADTMGIYTALPLFGNFNMRTNAGANQDRAIAGVGPGTHYIAMLLDRDSGNRYAFVDGVQVDVVATTQDPDLSSGGTLNLVSAAEVNSADIVHWRTRITSLSNGACPTDWSAILRYQRDADTQMHKDLVAAIGTVASDYRMGEGLYGSVNLTDTGIIAGNNLMWFGGVLVEDVRTRRRTPPRQTRRTFFALRPGYTATVAATDFGFAVQPVIFRILFGKVHPRVTVASRVGRILAAVSADYVRLDTFGGTARALVNASGVDLMPFAGDQHNGGDFWFVCNGTDVKFYLNGQLVFDDTLAAAIDLTGNCTIDMNGTGGPSCRIAAWNPATVPATFIDEIRGCVMDPESDPASLVGSKLVDFPIRSDLIAAGGNTVVNQAPSGLGTLTLSGIRSTSCREFARGYDP